MTAEILDRFNNVLTYDNADTVTLAIGTNPGGGTLSGTLTVTVSGGVATFSDLSIDKAGSGYTLAANGVGLAAVASGGFAITPAAADHLLFFQQPTDTAAGQTISPVIVEVVDQFGNVVTTDTSRVTLSLGSNPSGGTLSVEGDPSQGFRITARGMNARIPQPAERFLTGAAVDGVDAHAIQPYYAALLAQDCGLRVSLANEGEAIVISAQ